MSTSNAVTKPSAIPADDLRRNSAVRNANNDEAIHLGVVGDTYTVLLSGSDTGGQFCLIDMHVPPGGGPPPHRHDFEETFVIVDGELDATFRGKTSTVRAGDTIHIPANAPHQVHNSSSKPVRMFCICSPAGLEQFFKEIGAPVKTRTTAPPQLDQAQQAQFMKKVMELAPKYRTELLKEPK
jgi:mannose-6-phosphate isomerase-like protein (cupin superfamily)